MYGLVIVDKVQKVKQIPSIQQNQLIKNNLQTPKIISLGNLNQFLFMLAASKMDYKNEFITTK